MSKPSKKLETENPRHPHDEIAAVLDGTRRWCVITGDAFSALASLADGAVDHVITDPPYTDRTSKNARTAPDGSNGSALGDAKAFIGFAGITDESTTTLALEAARVARRWVLAFCALEQIGLWAAADPKAWIRATTWHRTNSAPQFTGDRPGQAHEGIAILHRKGRKKWNRGGTCWAPTGPTINAVSDKNRGHLDHPTPKPEWLMIDAVKSFCDAGDVIFDPFAGSGTTGVAALRMGCRAILVERDHGYADLCRERMAAEEAGHSIASARAGQMTMLVGR